jgi:antitoxin component YwqK of YwqJK toxin-antitoxin module
MSEVEKKPEALNTLEEIVSTFSHQVPGVEIGFDVLTGFALIFTALGYLFSASKDRENTSNQEISKTSNKLLEHIQQSEISFTKIDVYKLNEHIILFQNYLYFELTPSVAKWMSFRKAIETTEKAKELTQELALTQMKVYKFLNILIDEKPIQDENDDLHVKDRKKKEIEDIDKQIEHQREEEEKLINRFQDILNLMKELFEIINNSDQALTNEMLDDKNTAFDKIILRLNTKGGAFLEKTKWPSLFVLSAGLMLYLLVSNAIVLIYIIGLMILVGIVAFLYSKYLHNDEETSEFKSDGYVLPLKYGRIDGTVKSEYNEGKIKSEECWKNGKKEGLETQWYESGEKKSETSFKAGKKEGLATSRYEDGEKESETSFKAGKKEGLETRWYEDDKKKSKTNFKDGKKEGLATSWYEDGEKESETNFKAGKKEGLETRWYEDGKKKSETNFKADKKEGLHTWWVDNGKNSNKIIKDKYKDNKKESHIVINNNMKIFEIIYKNGERERSEIEFYENGEKESETSFKAGKKEGLETKWHESGEKKSETSFKAGKKECSIEFNNNKKTLEIIYKNGEKEILETVFYEDGEKESESSFKDDKKEGLATWWYESGEKKSEVNYKDDMEEGLCSEWYENGQKKNEGNYKDGENEGLVKWWHDDGSKFIEVNFKGGKLHGSRTFWDNGGVVTFTATYNNGSSNNQNGLEPQYDEGNLTHYIEYKDGVIINDNVTA